MNEIERERSMPVFIFLSMLFHALLFLFAPQITASLIPGFKPGDQGGVAFVTLVDVAMPETPQASVVAAARRPESVPEPKAKPEPQPEPTEEPTPASEPETTPAPDPEEARVQEIQVEPVAERPAEEKPQATRPAAADEPQPAETPQRENERPASESVELERVQEESTPSLTPVITSERGERVVATAAPPQQETESTSGSAATAAQSDQAARAEAEPSEPQSGSPAETGTGAGEDIPSAAPQAEPAEEPALPPTGDSMVRSYGGTLFPKNAVGLLTGVVTVEVAAVVNPQGEVLEASVIDSSGIPFIDDYSLKIAELSVHYKPFDEIYEIRVFVTYDSDKESLTYRTGDFIKTPPTVGSYAP